MANKNISSNEAADRTVDEKLGKWREHSRSLAKQREKERQEIIDKGGIKKMKLLFGEYYDKNRSLVRDISIISIVVIIAAIIGVIILNNSGVKISKYVSVGYYGADGFASPVFNFDDREFLDKLTKNEKDEGRLDMFRRLADSVEIVTSSRDLSNGDKYEVQVKYDENIAEELDVKIKGQRYVIKASGISSGIVINLFSKVEAVFAGISGDAYIILNNKWEHEYLRTLEFSADKTENIKKDDIILITCDTSKEDLARNGFRVETTQINVRAENLSRYAEYEDIDRDVLLETYDKVFETIISETEDLKFRMLYKATGDSSFLRNSNSEYVYKMSVTDTFFAKGIEDMEANSDNIIFVVAEAEIFVEESDVELDVYFAFSFDDSFINLNDELNVATDNISEKYICSSDYETIIGYVMEFEEDYTLYELEEE